MKGLFAPLRETAELVYLGSVGLAPRSTSEHSTSFLYASTAIAESAVADAVTHVCR